MKTIKGIAWDHPRGFDSIVAATEQYLNTSATCRIKWDKRSLTEFGDLSLSLLTDNYDLLIIDHPFVGEAHASELLLPLKNILSSEFLEIQSRLHIGPCYTSYTFAGHQYALPVDAAAQCCAYNPKGIGQANIPNNWEDYLYLMKDSKFNNKVLWPLCPTDMWCSFLTLAAQLGKNEGDHVFDGDGLNVELSLGALDWLKKLTKNISLQCLNMNPIETLISISRHEDHMFSPLIFGYNNYCRKGYRGLEFSNVFGFKGEQPTSLLGGAGIAVSSKSRNYSELAGFLRFIMRDEIMSGSYFEAGGQPSLKSSWSSDTLNQYTSDFFSKTNDTIVNAYTRPCLPGFSTFQIEAAELIHGAIRGLSDAAIVREMNLLYQKHCC